MTSPGLSFSFLSFTFVLLPQHDFAGVNTVVSVRRLSWSDRAVTLAAAGIVEVCFGGTLCAMMHFIVFFPLMKRMIQTHLLSPWTGVCVCACGFSMMELFSIWSLLKFAGSMLFWLHVALDLQSSRFCLGR